MQSLAVALAWYCETVVRSTMTVAAAPRARLALRLRSRRLCKLNSCWRIPMQPHGNYVRTLLSLSTALFWASFCWGIIWAKSAHYTSMRAPECYVYFVWLRASTSYFEVGQPYWFSYRAGVLEALIFVISLAVAFQRRHAKWHIKICMCSAQKHFDILLTIKKQLS